MPLREGNFVSEEFLNTEDRAAYKKKDVDIKYAKNRGVNFSELDKTEEVFRPEKYKKALERLETGLKWFFRDIKVEGKENLKDIQKGSPTILAISHLSDVDIHLTLCNLAEEFGYKVKFVTAADNFDNPAWDYGMKVVLGIDPKEVSLPVSVTHKKNKSVGHESRFEEKDFDAMRQALQDGYVVAVAAHKPEYSGQLPKNPGIAASYLALSSKSEYPVTVVPVAVNIESKERVASVPEIFKQKLKGKRNRADVVIKIGEKEVVTPTKGNNFENKKDVVSNARPLANRLMTKIAAMLPENKRGSWLKNN